MRTLYKDMLRQLKSTIGRFLSIALISMLGVGSFAGLRSVSPDMTLTADTYYVDQSLMDIYAVSTLGFSQRDLDALSASGLILQPSYTLDAFVGGSGDTAELVAKVYGIGDGDTLNLPLLKEGRMPMAADECVMDTLLVSRLGLSMGDVVTLASGKEEAITDTLKRERFTLVGSVVSPLYVSLERGGAGIGDGEAKGSIYLPNEAFDLEVNTLVFLGVEEASGLAGSSEAYELAIDSALERVKAIAALREPARYAEIMEEADEKIADAQAELQDGEREREEKLAEAKAKMDDARQKIADADIELADGRQEFQREIAKAERELDDGERELEEAYIELMRGELELSDGEREIILGEYELKKARQKLEVAEYDLNNVQKTIDEGGAALTAGERQLQQGKAALDQGADALRQMGVPEDNPLWDSIHQGYDDYRQGLKSLERGSKELSEGKAEFRKGWEAVQDGWAELEKSEEDLAAARIELADGKRELAQGRQDYYDGLAELEKGRKTLESEREKGLAEIADGERKLRDAKAELSDGEREYAQQELESGQKIADAWAELDKARADLAELEEPEWFIFTRDDLPAHAEYYQDAEKIAAIGVVFPFVFFAVAVLISVTTISRMVDEQRGAIGTMKMLGYDGGAIASKYVLYAFVSCALGCSGGLVMGRYLFPYIIASAYNIKYNFPPVLMPFQWEPSLIAVITSIVLVVGASYLAVRQEMSQSPAQLLRPRAPKPGKRILLEEIRPLWRLFSFTWKVAARNVFRYKARFIMTILGIAGCTALLLTGFGIKDSLNAVPQLQFDRIWHYDLLVAVDRDSLEEGVQGLEQALEEEGAKDILWWRQESMTARKTPQGKRLDVSLVAAEDIQALCRMVSMQTYPRGEVVAWDGQGAIITYKIAKLLDIGPGDLIELTDQDNIMRTFPVAAVTENYINHFVYVSQETLAQAGGDTLSNVAVATLADSSPPAQSRLAAKLTATQGVLMHTFTADTRDSVSDMFEQLNIIVFVLIVCAGALALAVLFNLNNINIAERVRELATIKVLGFMQKEVAAYVLRESAILTGIGIALGCAGGIFLHRFVMSTAEIEMVMFGRQIAPVSFALSILMTIGFAVLVAAAMLPKLNRIDMVESLKSVE